MIKIHKSRFFYLDINSSKVYCKSVCSPRAYACRTILIVAKCIVNYHTNDFLVFIVIILIVAKCIVNGYPVQVHIPLLPY